METIDSTSSSRRCEKCDFICYKQSDYDRHILTRKHRTTIQNSPKIHRCESCDYTCFKPSDMNKHLSTRKHLNTINVAEKGAEIITCDKCNATYKHKSSLWKHRKTCNGIVHSNYSKTDVTTLTNLVIELVKNNNDLQKQLMDMCQKSTCNTIVNNTNTNNNQKFNINVFLNEECKNAMNFEDFLNGIEVTQEDIQNNGRLGFVDGISKIIIDNLNMLSVHQRPIHCTDWKREVMYIKDDNKWTREIDDKKMEDAIQVVSQKSIRTLHAWKMSNPDYKNSYSAFALECIDMQLHSVAGYHREVYYPKVAKLIARHVLLEKKTTGT